MSAPAPLTHLLISASAGAGKTYQLVQRYLHLLALGEDAEGIAAMTFTRKAAGEFFSRILRRLAELAEPGAGDREAAAAYFAGAQPPVKELPDFQAILRRVTRRMHRLRLGTMDSFFAIMAACFPLELALPAGARVMDEDEARQARREALDALLERLYVEDAKAAHAALLEAYKQATFGAEEKSVDASLQDWAAGGLALWEECGMGGRDAAECWGRPGRIWPRGAAVHQPLAPMAEVIEEARAAFRPNNKKGEEMLEELLEQALLTVPGLAPPKRVAFFLDKCHGVWSDLKAGRAELAWGKKIEVSGAAARALVRLAEALMAREFLVRGNRTRGLAGLMALFAAEYEQRVRSRGRLSFADVQRLLSVAAAGGSPWGAGGNDLWFRMDGRYQHWLLDEFQDTSRAQWRVISGLVDEVMQDAEGRRSFFAVGDPKQSIYLWRQAEPGLFADVLTAYPARAGGGLHQRPLSKSYRSAQPVLDAVNEVFGARAGLEALLPHGSLDGFAFEPHEASQTHLTGCAALLSPPLAGQKDEQITTVEAAAALLRRLQPLRRGLSCALLVRQNKDARAVTEELRLLTDMEIVCESDQHPCTDNAVTLALVSLLSLAAHPADSQAEQHLRMTPLWAEINGHEHGWKYEITVIQSLIYEKGFAAFMEAWSPRVWRAHPEMDAFHARRMAQMGDIAAEFDGMGNRDIDAFIEFAREYPLRTRGAGRAIQVMTVHAAKGLEFDIVILPKLDDRAMNEARADDLLVRRDAEGVVQWVLQTPPKAYSYLDETLNAELVETERRMAFESLCRLYVAMTRAKRALYLIADVPPKEANALKESKLLREQLGAQAGSASGTWDEGGAPFAVIEWETGQPLWYEDCAVVPVPMGEAAPVHEALGPLLRATQPMPRRRTPSGEETFRVKGSVFFSEGREIGRNLGTLVHALFAEVAYVDRSSPSWADDVARLWWSKGLIGASAESDPAEAKAFQMVSEVLQSPDCEEAFRPLKGNALLWREKPFDLMLDGEWVSGIFDRVMLATDGQGKVTASWIIDFKTDDVPDATALAAKVAGYKPQLELYRQALARLTGLDQAAIRMSLLFTRAVRLVPVP